MISFMTEAKHDSRLHLVDHPCLLDRLTTLRAVETSPPTFRRQVQFIAQFLAYEALADTPLGHRVVETPLQLSKQPCLPETAPTFIAILRAGMAMVDGALQVSPDSPVGMVGVQRNEETLQPEPYYLRLPEALDARLCLVCDPMLATGGSLCHALEILKAQGAKRLRVLCLLAAPEGVERVLAAHRDITIWTVALDERLNARGYIIPGLGDAGDRIYGMA